MPRELRGLGVAVTGAWSYSGRRVVPRLLRAGCRVVSLTNRFVPVDDLYACAVVDAVGGSGSCVRDAVGPDRMEFGDLVRTIASLACVRCRVVGVPPPVCAALYRAASAVVRETVLTADELAALSRGRLDSLAEPLGSTSLKSWLRARGAGLGRRFVREPPRWSW